VSSGAPVVVHSGAAGGRPQAQQQPSIVVKQTVKQIVGGEVTKRRKAVKHETKRTLTTRKKEYNSLKKSVKASLQRAKKENYKRGDAEIKSMPKGDRVAARKRLRADLKKKHSVLLKQLPATGRLTLADISALINKIKRIKW